MIDSSLNIPHLKRTIRRQLPWKLCLFVCVGVNLKVSLSLNVDFRNNSAIQEKNDNALE